MLELWATELLGLGLVPVWPLAELCFLVLAGLASLVALFFWAWSLVRLVFLALGGLSGSALSLLSMIILLRWEYCIIYRVFSLVGLPLYISLLLYIFILLYQSILCMFF